MEKINNYTINKTNFPFLDFNDPNIDHIIKQYITLGYQVSKSIQFSPESNSDIFNSINNSILSINDTNKNIYNELEYSISNLNQSINRFQGKSQNSSLKGKEMENIIEDILINNFPDDTISCTAKSSMESDFNIDLNNNISGMIEIKCYNHTKYMIEIYCLYIVYVPNTTYTLHTLYVKYKLYIAVFQYVLFSII